MAEGEKGNSALDFSRGYYRFERHPLISTDATTHTARKKEILGKTVRPTCDTLYYIRENKRAPRSIKRYKEHTRERE